MSQGAASSEKWAGGIRESDRIGTPPPPNPNKIFYFVLKGKVLWLLFKQKSQVDRTGGWEWMREADALKWMEKKPTFQNIFLLLYKTKIFRKIYVI